MRWTRCSNHFYRSPPPNRPHPPTNPSLPWQSRRCRRCRFDRRLLDSTQATDHYSKASSDFHQAGNACEGSRHDYRFASKATYSKIQTQILDGTLEEEIRKAVKPIYPVKSVAIRKSQLLQAGVVTDKGKTLDEIHAEEARSDAELKAKKAAALAAAMEGEDEEGEEEDATPSIIDAAEAMEPASEKAPAEEAPAEEAPAEEAAPTADYESMKVAELKELLKAAGKPVSGKKADLIARLNE